MDGEATADLIRRAKAGDREAAGELARRYEERVRALVHGRLAPRLRVRVDTEDLVQSTIREVLSDLRGVTYDGESAFVHWLASVAEHQVISKARHHLAGKRNAARERPLEEAASILLEQTSPPEGAVRQETAARLQAALARLPERERRVIELHSFGGMGFAEVAQAMGLSGKGAVYRLFERALKRMGQLLDAGGAERSGAPEPGAPCPPRSPTPYN